MSSLISPPKKEIVHPYANFNPPGGMVADTHFAEKVCLGGYSRLLKQGVRNIAVFRWIPVSLDIFEI